MKLKRYSKWILFIAFISCTALLSTNLVNTSGSQIENKQRRIIIESPNKAYVPESNESTMDKGTRVTEPSTNSTSKSPVEPLPVPDANAPIIINLL